VYFQTNIINILI